jgi:hypothetical protein
VRVGLRAPLTWLSASPGAIFALGTHPSNGGGSAMNRRTFLLASTAAVALYASPTAASPGPRVFSRDSLDRLWRIVKATPGDGAALREALKAEFGGGIVVFKDELATVEVNISGVKNLGDQAHQNVNVIPVRIVEPKSHDVGWRDHVCWGPEAEADFAKGCAVSFGGDR